MLKSFCCNQGRNKLFILKKIKNFFGRVKETWEIRCIVCWTKKWIWAPHMVLWFMSWINRPQLGLVIMGWICRISCIFHCSKSFPFCMGCIFISDFDAAWHNYHFEIKFFFYIIFLTTIYNCYPIEGQKPIREILLTRRKRNHFGRIEYSIQLKKWRQKISFFSIQIKTVIPVSIKLWTHQWPIYFILSFSH